MVFLGLGLYPWRLEQSGNSFYSSPDWKELWNQTSQVAGGTLNIFAVVNVFPFVCVFLTKKKGKQTIILNVLVCYHFQNKRRRCFGG